MKDGISATVGRVVSTGWTTAFGILSTGPRGISVILGSDLALIGGLIDGFPPKRTLGLIRGTRFACFLEGFLVVFLLGTCERRVFAYRFFR
jgi:hypothetical protein